MHLISAGGLHGKGFGGHTADSVFNEKQGRNHGNTLLYAPTRLLQSSCSVHVADASESAFISYPGPWALGRTIRGRDSGAGVDRKTPRTTTSDM